MRYIRTLYIWICMTQEKCNVDIEPYTARDNKTYVWSIAIIEYNNQLSKPIYVNYFELT